MQDDILIVTYYQKQNLIFVHKSQPEPVVHSAPEKTDAFGQQNLLDLFTVM